MDPLTIISLIISIISLLATLGVGGIGLWYARKISAGQKKQLDEIQELNQSLDKKILGTLPTFDSVYLKMIELLEEANQDRQSKVWLMMYWLWFGSDLILREQGIEQINKHSSKVRQLIGSRIAMNYETNAVIYAISTPGDRLKDFLKTVLKYRLDKEGKQSTITEESLLALLERYKDDIKALLHDVENNQQQKLILSQEIPLLIFAVEGSKRSAGLVYLGETAELKREVDTGGFYSEEPKAVKIFISHIAAIARPPQLLDNTMVEPRQLTGGNLPFDTAS